MLVRRTGQHSIFVLCSLCEGGRDGMSRKDCFLLNGEGDTGVAVLVRLYIFASFW